MECAANDETVDATDALIPSTPRVVGPHSQRGGYGNGDGRAVRFDPITIVPQSSLDGVSRHGAVVVATLATTSKLFDIVLRPNIAASPITTIKQLAGAVAGSWVFAKTTIDILNAHGLDGTTLVAAARRDSEILVRAVVILMVRRIVKLEGFAAVGNILSLFQFVKVAGALAESRSSEAAGFLNEIAAVPMKVFSAVAVLLSEAIDIRLRKGIALAIGSVLSEARTQLVLLDRNTRLTALNVERRFYESYGMIDRFLRMGLGVPHGVDARAVLLQWRQSV